LHVVVSSVLSSSTALDRGQFFGRVVMRTDVAGLVLSETRHVPHGAVPSHAHAGALLTLVLDGSFVERVGRRTDDLGSGKVVFHPAGESHANQFNGGGARCFNVQFGDEWLARAVEGGVSTEDRVMCSDPTSSGRALALWRESVSGEGLPLALEGMASLLLAAVLPGARPLSPRTPSWLPRAIEQLRASVVSPPSTSVLAAEAGVHPVYFTRAFRAAAGCTPGEYVRRCRIEWACARLRGSRAPLSDIAQSAGFADQSHFTRTFRRIVGVTPGVYRKAVGQG
jgi:AraC family transcriptional regulator